MRKMQALYFLGLLNIDIIKSYIYFIMNLLVL